MTKVSGGSHARRRRIRGGLFELPLTSRGGPAMIESQVASPAWPPTHVDCVRARDVAKKALTRMEAAIAGGRGARWCSVAPWPRRFRSDGCPWVAASRPGCEAHASCGLEGIDQGSLDPSRRAGSSRTAVGSDRNCRGVDRTAVRSDSPADLRTVRALRGRRSVDAADLRPVAIACAAGPS